MKNLSKNKIIFILFFAIIILFCLTTKTNASYDFNYNDVNYSIPDLPDDISSQMTFKPTLSYYKFEQQVGYLQIIIINLMEQIEI